MNKIDKKTVIVVGGGAAGLMAGGMAAQNGHDVMIIEPNRRMARKIMITGKGRCNVTNNCDINTFINNVPTNGKFLYSTLNGFSPQDMMEFLESKGLELKTERGNRVFPKSDKAHDVVDTLVMFAKRSGCKFKRGKVESLIIEDNICHGVKLQDGNQLKADKTIICTGGKSYTLTGSTGDGYTFAKEAGHNIIDIEPSLVPIECLESWCMELQGLSLKNCGLKIIDSDESREIYSAFGEMLFTHFGVSGPMILSASAHIRDIKNKNYQISIDLKPTVTSDVLEERILRRIDENKNKSFLNMLETLLPKSMVSIVCDLTNISPKKPCHSVTKEERKSLVTLLKDLRITILGFRPVEEAIVTSGGVDVREIDAKTMSSKLIKGLAFAGEVVDVDAYTGGFNLQIAFSTGVAAGRYA